MEVQGTGAAVITHYVRQSLNRASVLKTLLCNNELIINLREGQESPLLPSGHRHTIVQSSTRWHVPPGQQGEPAQGSGASANSDDTQVTMTIAIASLKELYTVTWNGMFV